MTRKLFQVIDLDRVLFDTEKFANALTDELRGSNPILAEKLHCAFDDAYANEETFFLLRELREIMGDNFTLFVETVVQAHGGGSAFLLSGARERLAFADSMTSVRPSLGILTYGDEIDQLMKLEIVNLSHLPVIISRTPNKSEILRQWQRSDGTFLLPQEFGAQVVTELTLEDDKLRAFDHMPIGVSGLWVNRTSAAQTVTHVRRVGNLHESIDYLKTI